MLLSGYRKEIMRPECNPSFQSLHCIAHLDDDVGEVVPYLNAVLGGTQCLRDPPAVSFLHNGRLITVHGRTIAINAIRDRKTSSTRAYYLATGVELEALREALLVHDVQLQHCSVSELQEAWRVIEAQEQTAKGAMRSRRRGVVSQGTDSVRA